MRSARTSWIVPIDEDDFRAEMACVGAISVAVWANAPGDTYAPHSHAYRKVLCCLDGSIIFHLPDGEVRLNRGDRVVIEAGHRHAASVGPGGVRCAEAHFA